MVLHGFSEDWQPGLRLQPRNQQLDLSSPSEFAFQRKLRRRLCIDQGDTLVVKRQGANFHALAIYLRHKIRDEIRENHIAPLPAGNPDSRWQPFGRVGQSRGEGRLADWIQMCVR